MVACSAPPGEGTETTAPDDTAEAVANAAELIKNGELLYPATNSLFRYDVYKTHIIIVEYLSTETDVVVPETIETLPVLRIEKNAFKDCEHITSVKLPDTLVEIGNSAFEGCKNMATINLPKNIMSLGESVFENCDALTELTIPMSLNRIPQHMCDNCDNLVTVVWEDMEYDEANRVEKSIGSYAFYKCKKLTLLWIPDEVIDIGSVMVGEAPYLVIHGYTSSAAAHYASKNFIDFEVLDKENLATAIKDAQDEAAKREEESTTPGEPTEPTVSTQPTESTTPNE